MRRAIDRRAGVGQGRQRGRGLNQCDAGRKCPVRYQELAVVRRRPIRRADRVGVTDEPVETALAGIVRIDDDVVGEAEVDPGHIGAADRDADPVVARTRIVVGRRVVGRRRLATVGCRAVSPCLLRDGTGNAARRIGDGAGGVESAGRHRVAVTDRRRANPYFVVPISYAKAEVAAGIGCRGAKVGIGVVVQFDIDVGECEVVGTAVVFAGGTSKVRVFEYGAGNSLPRTPVHGQQRAVSGRSVFRRIKFPRVGAVGDNRPAEIRCSRGPCLQCRGQTGNRLRSCAVGSSDLRIERRRRLDIIRLNTVSHRIPGRRFIPGHQHSVEPDLRERRRCVCHLDRQCCRVDDRAVWNLINTRTEDVVETNQPITRVVVVHSHETGAAP